MKSTPLGLSARSADRRTSAAALDHRPPRPTPFLAVSILSIALAFGCGNDDNAGSGGGGSGGGGTGGGVNPPTSAFALAVRVVSPTGATGFVVLTDTLEADSVVELSLDRAIETTGAGSIYPGPGESVFVGSGDSPTLQRWSLAESGELALVPEGEVSFANEGLTNTATGRPSTVQLVADDKAYFLHAAFADVIVFDPTALEIRGRIEIPGLPPRDGETGDFSRTSFRDGDRIHVTYSYRDINRYNVIPRTTLVVIDTLTDTVTTDTVEGCGETALGARGADGAMYWATGIHGAAVHRATGPETAPVPCLLRVSPGASSFDEGFREDLRALVGGAPAGDLVGAGDGRALLRVYDETVVPIDPQIDGFELRANPGWRWWGLDLATLTSTEFTDDPFRAAPTIPYSLGDSTYVAVFEGRPDEGFDSILQVAVPNAAPRPVLRVPGILQGGIVQIR